MNLRTSIGAAITAAFLVAGVASAQTVPSSVVTVTSNPVTTSPIAGTNGVTLGTITLGAPSSGTATISSIPLTVTPANGGTASNLSSCQLFNASGTALNTGNNIGTIQSGSNTVTLDQPLTLIGSNSATLTVRCNVASVTQSGSTFNIVAGQPTFSPGLMVGFTAAPSIQVGTLNSLGIITLDATRSGAPVTVTSLPLTITAGSGNSISNLSNCSVRDAGNIAVPLNSGVNAIATPSGNASFTLDTPLSVAAGTTKNLAVVCTVNAGATVGGSFVVSTTPANVLASSNGSTISPTTGLTSTGATAPISGTVLLAANSGTGTGSAPGLPNTGAGGNALADMRALAFAGILAIFGVRYLTTRTV